MLGLSQIKMHQLFGAIELLLCYIPNSNYTDKISIEQLANLVNKGHLFADLSSGDEEKDRGILHIIGLPISQIVSLYEVLEEDLFIYVVDIISPEYKVMQLDNVSTEQLV